MLISMPFAVERSMSSSKGLEIAISAAFSARPSPSASPVPIMALPMPVISVRTSAKSRFQVPEPVIRSLIALTPLYKTSSAIFMASENRAFSFAMRNRCWFGITIIVSTLRSSSSIPASAILRRLRPSKSNGRVTTPTVKMPLAFSSLAISGAAPVPVPPPMPAVMKTMCAPPKAFSTSSMLSSAAARPVSGSVPAPKPSVRAPPS